MVIFTVARQKPRDIEAAMRGTPAGPCVAHIGPAGHARHLRGGARGGVAFPREEHHLTRYSKPAII